jgi:dolichyl-phosphate-mannose-protein mannosyltransferase
MSNATLDAAAVASPEVEVTPRPKFSTWLAAAYGSALLVCLSVWVLAVRAPLWTDETLSYWQIAAGFKQIWARSIQGNSFAAYAYILWFTKTMFGDKELVLRIPSILAMLAAVYVFYRCARELFAWDVSLIATMLFVLPRGIAFAAIDVRPYGFALLVTNLTILLFLRWKKTNRIRYAGLFGISAAGIFYFHYLFASILAALAVYYLLTRHASLRTDLRQIGVALSCFAIFMLPVLPRLRYVYQTRSTHSFADAPQWTSVVQALNPGTGQLLVLAGVILIAAVARQLMTPNRETLDKLLLCASLGFVPILCLYTISVTTPVHVFIPRYLLVAMPGIALCWGWLCNAIDSRALRALFCFAFVGLCAFQAYASPLSRRHEESWKESLAFADANAAEDHASLLMCSPLVEADFLPMPAVASESVLYAPLSYYKVSAPVIPLPRTLNGEAERQAKQFLLKAAQEHSRFLVLAPWPSLRIVDFLTYYSQSTHSPRVLGRFDEIWVVEFIPYSDAR